MTPRRAFILRAYRAYRLKGWSALAALDLARAALEEAEEATAYAESL